MKQNIQYIFAKTFLSLSWSLVLYDELSQAASYIQHSMYVYMLWQKHAPAVSSSY